MRPVLVAGAGVLGALAFVGLVAYGRHRWRTRDRRALATDLEAALAGAMAPGTGSHLEEAPTVRRIARVGPDDDPRYLPVVRIDLETTDAPGTKIVLEYVADALEAIHPELRGRNERVAGYEVEFAFGPDGLLVEGECRRVTVAPDLADRLLEDDRYGAFELWRDVKRGDREDGLTTLWEPCRSSVRAPRERSGS